MKRLSDTDRPLPLCLHWADVATDSLNRTRFVLQENDTGEILVRPNTACGLLIIKLINMTVGCILVLRHR